MPRIELIPEVYYNPLDPYHHYYDNKPLVNIIERQGLINTAVDLNTEDLKNAAGNQGTLANRLNQSIDEDGSIKLAAIDELLHNIGAHTDGSYDDGDGLISYVRMKNEERDKLELIDDEANNFAIEVETPSVTQIFDNGVLTLAESDTVVFEILGGNIVKAHSAFPAAAAHQHYYDITPVHANISSPDYTNYKVTSMSTPYMANSLRVYINGVKLSTSTSIYVPSPALGDNWYLTTYTADEANGTFELSRAIDITDVIRIDFDIDFT